MSTQMSTPIRNRAKQPADILLVEDHPDGRELLHAFLGDEGFHVEVACNGKDALAKLEKSRPRLVLLDLMMPVMSGWECYERIRADARFRDLPVVVISAVRDAGPPGGIQGYLPKPINLEHLRNLVKQFCGPRPTTVVAGVAANDNALAAAAPR